MKTQLEFYDKDILKNIQGVLTLRPERVVYFYDNTLTDRGVFTALERCLQRRLPGLLVETEPVDITRMPEIFAKVQETIRRYGDCDVDLTGGSELMLLAGFQAGLLEGARLFYTDLSRRKVISLGSEALAYDIPALSLEDFVTARGAAFAGNSQEEPRPEDYEAILGVCRYIFRHLRDWKDTCAYVQAGMSGAPPQQRQFCCPNVFRNRSRREVSPSWKLLRVLERAGFLRELSLSPQEVRFVFRDSLSRKYATTYGIWLELWVFIHAKRIPAFDDVRLGAMIDWDVGDRRCLVGNEIDVLLSMDSIPVFISCKLREAGAPDVNELVVAKKRLGGWFSKGLLVCFGHSRTQNTEVYRRGLDLGVEMLDERDLLSPDFGKRLLAAVRDYDLVKMKWTKV